MGIQIETTVYGKQIGRELASNPEELAYALNAMSEWDGANLGSEVAAFIWSDTHVAAFLRSMADAIDAGGGDEL
jgi:hypothetical protein